MSELKDCSNLKTVLRLDCQDSRVYSDYFLLTVITQTVVAAASAAHPRARLPAGATAAAATIEPASVDIVAADVMVAVSAMPPPGVV